MAAWLHGLRGLHRLHPFASLEYPPALTTLGPMSRRCCRCNDWRPAVVHANRYLVHYPAQVKSYPLHGTLSRDGVGVMKEGLEDRRRTLPVTEDADEEGEEEGEAHSTSVKPTHYKKARAERVRGNEDRHFKNSFH